MTDLEVFATGLQMGESRRWHDGALWVCDWMAGEVLRFDSAGGREVVTRGAGMPVSLDWLPDGILGGDDGCDLYVVANDYGENGIGNGPVLRTRVDVPHAGRP